MTEVTIKLNTRHLAGACMIGAMALIGAWLSWPYAAAWNAEREMHNVSYDDGPAGCEAKRRVAEAWKRTWNSANADRWNIDAEATCAIVALRAGRD